MWSQSKKWTYFLFGMIGMTKHNHKKSPFAEKSLHSELLCSLHVLLLHNFYNYRAQFALSNTVKIIEIGSLSVDVDIFEKPPHTTRSGSPFLVPWQKSIVYPPLAFFNYSSYTTLSNVL